jgi:hypothetical protein
MGLQGLLQGKLCHFYIVVIELVFVEDLSFVGGCSTSWKYIKNQK